MAKLKVSAPSTGELDAAMLEVLGKKANRFMGASSKLNTFLTGNFSVPSSIKEPVRWAEKQSLGVLNGQTITQHLSAMKSEKIDLQVREKAEWLASLRDAMTPAQKQQVEPALAKYRDFLSQYVASARVAKSVVERLTGTVSAHATVVTESVPA